MPTAGWHVAQVLGTSAILLVRLQVALIYFHAGVAKTAVVEWANGTALYYWFTNPGYGMPPWLESALGPLLVNRYAVAMLTWGVIAFEVTLFLALVLDRRWRRMLLPLALAFHLMIVLVHGLGPFFFAMAAALIMYLRPSDAPFTLLSTVPWLRRLRGAPWWRRRTARSVLVPMATDS